MKRKKKNMKKADPNPKANRHILMITYGMAALFAGLVLYFAFFLQIKSISSLYGLYYTPASFRKSSSERIGIPSSLAFLFLDELDWMSLLIR